MFFHLIKCTKSVIQYKLGKIAEELGIKVEVAHRALDDVDTTVKVFNVMIQKLKDKGATTVEEIDTMGKDEQAAKEEYKKLKETKFVPSVYADDSAVVRKCRDGLTATKMIFETYLNEMDDDSVTTKVITHEGDFDKVFIVHGHDSELKLSVARLVEKQGLEAIILNEQANKGKTIIEKFEEKKAINPEKQGNILDTDFNKVWMDSCDEYEKQMIWQCGFKAYNVAQTMCIILWMIFTCR